MSLLAVGCGCGSWGAVPRQSGARARLAQVGVVADDERVLAAQLERHRRQRGGGRAHHAAAHLPPPRSPAVGFLDMSQDRSNKHLDHTFVL
jgi:hypothetical protein